MIVAKLPLFYILKYMSESLNVENIPEEKSGIEILRERIIKEEEELPQGQFLQVQIKVSKDGERWHDSALYTPTFTVDDSGEERMQFIAANSAGLQEKYVSIDDSGKMFLNDVTKETHEVFFPFLGL